jgi:hypothetical protein
MVYTAIIPTYKYISLLRNFMFHYGKQKNISLAICDTDFLKMLTKSWWRQKYVEGITPIQPIGTLGTGNSSLAVTLHQGNHDRNHNLWITVSTVIYILHMQVLPECCYIEKESPQWGNWNHLFCHRVSFL